MNEILKIVLSLSFSGSLFIFVLFLCKPLFKNRLSKRWQYYIWLIVIVRMLLPFTLEASPVDTLFQEVNQRAPIENIAPIQQQGIKDSVTAQNGETPVTTTPTAKFFSAVLLQNLWLVWLGVTLLLLIRKITVYQGFVRYIKAGRTEVSDTGLLDRLAQIGEQIGVKRPVELYTNSLISSSLLLGFFRPCIVLSTTNLPDSDFYYTVLHELTHYKRKDMFYKWLVQLTICLHWFNPLTYMMGHELGGACELACDEAVICKLDTLEQRTYGDTLLNAIEATGNYNNSIASMTLHKNGYLLKERLAAIMNYKKKSKMVVSFTFVLTLLFVFGAAAVGAYTAPYKGSPSLGEKGRTLTEIPLSPTNSTILYESGIYYILCDGATVDDRPISGVTDGIGITLVWKDRYSTYGPYEDPLHLVDDVKKQCEDLLGKGAITSNEAKLLTEAAIEIQLLYKQSDKEKSTLQESLILNFAPFRSYGLIYIAELDRAYFNGREVKAFVDIREMFSGGGYSFNLGYIEPDSNSTLYLMAVRDEKGLLMGIQEMSEKLQNDLYGIYDKPTLEKPYDPDLEDEIKDNLLEIHGGEDGYSAQDEKYVVFDATTNLKDFSIIATDKLNSADIPKTIAHWILTCKGSDEVNIKRTTVDGRIDAWIYYDSGTRLAWNMKTNGTTLKFMLTDNVPKSVSGATLIHYQAPAAYQELEVFFKSERLTINP